MDRLFVPTGADLPLKVLLAVPSSVLYNWQRELHRWGYFCVAILQGARSRDQVLADTDAGHVDILLTTLEGVRSHAEELAAVPWAAVIVDEAHRLKDPRTQLSRAFASIPARCRIGLTGTAIQNRLLELWALLDWATSGRAIARDEFKARIVDPILQGQRHNASTNDLAAAAVRT